MKPITTIAAAAGALLLLTGCDVKDAIYDTPHPEKGTITLTADWSGIGEGLTRPASYTVTAGDYSATLSGTTYLLDNLFTPGKYSIYTYNTAEHITVSGTIATVGEATGNVDGVGTFVSNVPGWLFTSVTEAVIEKDKDHAFTAVMRQQVRQLTLMIEPTGGTTDRIERIEGYLTGAAGTLDFADGTNAMHATPMNVELEFEKIAEGDNAGKWSVTVRLLGTAGAQQKLNAKLYFADGSPAPVTLESDLSEELATFNANKREPLVLGGKVVETPTGADFGATIIDWTPVNGGPVVAD